MIAALRRWLARIVGPLVIALTLGRVRVDWTGAESTARPDDGPAMMATETVEQAEDAGGDGGVAVSEHRPPPRGGPSPGGDVHGS